MHRTFGNSVSRRRVLQTASLATLQAVTCGAFAKPELYMTQSHADALEEHASAYSFDDTLDRVLRSIRAAGLMVFATIDHAAGARQAGLSMPPTRVLFYGHPKGGTPVMLATPAAAIELPLRVLIREVPSRGTIVAFRPIAVALEPLGVAHDVASKLEPSQRLLIDALRA